MTEQTVEPSARISCLIQSDGLAAKHEEELARRLQQHHLAYYPADQLVVLWRRAEPDRMFTAGAPSKTSAVSCLLGAKTTRAGREEYMRGICDLWIEVTGCSEHDVLVSISEIETAETTTENGQE